MRAPTAAPQPDAAALVGRQRLFVLVFTLVPLAVLAAASLRAETKIHWTGPIWLALLPVLAATMSRPGLGDGPLDRLLARSWVPVVHGLMLVYAYGLFYYPVWGVAGVRAHHHYVQMGWRDLRRQVQGIEEDVLRETGRRPAVVGLDKHNTADEMAFYDPRGDGARDTASRHLFYDENALMYEYWFPREAFAGRDLIVVARRRNDVEDPRVAAAATRLGPVQAADGAEGRRARRHLLRAGRLRLPTARAPHDEHRLPARGRSLCRRAAVRARRRCSTACCRGARRRRRRGGSS